MRTLILVRSPSCRQPPEAIILEHLVRQFRVDPDSSLAFTLGVDGRTINIRSSSHLPGSAHSASGTIFNQSIWQQLAGSEGLVKH